MSLNSPVLSRRSAEIAARFGARAESYELHAGLQRAVADKLARLLPQLDRPRVLELGCGTGLFSRHLIQRYPSGSFVLTDVAPAMIAQCRRNLTPTGNAHVSFEVMDAGEAGGHAGLDLIVSSMGRVTSCHQTSEARSSISSCWAHTAGIVYWSCNADAISRTRA